MKFNPKNLDKFINKKKMRFPKIFISLKSKLNPKIIKGIKVTSLVLLPIIGLTFCLLLPNNKPIEQTEYVNQEIPPNLVNRKIYLISKDGFTIPLTIKIEDRSNDFEEMIELINLLKTSSKYANENFFGYIPDNTKIISITKNEESITIDFSQEFLEYDEKYEPKIIEALNSTIMQFDGIKKVYIKVEGKELTELPKLHTKIYHHKQMLNIIANPLYNQVDKTLISIFYQKQYKDKDYLLPISLYVEDTTYLNNNFVSAINKSIPSHLLLKQIDIYKQIAKNQDTYNQYTFNVNNTALIDETTVNRELFELIYMSFDLMDIEENVSFSIEDEILQVDGIYDISEAVSDITYNEVSL